MTSSPAYGTCRWGMTVFYEHSTLSKACNCLCYDSKYVTLSPRSASLNFLQVVLNFYPIVSTIIQVALILFPSDLAFFQVAFNLFPIDYTFFLIDLTQIQVALNLFQIDLNLLKDALILFKITLTPFSIEIAS